MAIRVFPLDYTVITEVSKMYEHLRELREDNDWRQIDIARILNVHQTTYSDYELGRLNIPVNILIRLAQLYRTSIDYLLDRTNDPTPYPPRRS